MCGIDKLPVATANASGTTTPIRTAKPSSAQVSGLRGFLRRTSGSSPVTAAGRSSGRLSVVTALEVDSAIGIETPLRS